MKFAIRDDDTSYFTKPSELESAYDCINSGCVSLSVVPFAFPYHKTSKPYGDGYEEGYYCISDNREICAYLKEQFANGRFYPMLHGYSHEYRQVNGKWEAEMLWKDGSVIAAELKEGKKTLEDEFGVPLSVFVAPNNLIDSRTIAAMEELGLDYSGIIGRKKDRAVDGYYIKNYLKRTLFKLRYDMPYPGVMQFARHRELYAFPLKSEEYLKNVYAVCKKNNAPFVLYTHYFELNADPGKKLLLEKMYRYALEDGAVLLPLNKCFE